MLGIVAQADPSPVVVSLTASTATQLTAVRTSAVRGIAITADPTNTSPIFIGDSSVSATARYYAVVQAGDPPILIPVSDASKLYAYSVGVTQKFGWAGL